MGNFSSQIESAYDAARDIYAAAGVNTEQALQALAQVPISIQCWQGDDVGGFEHADALSGGGIQATGNYPGKARNGDELRGDFSQMLRFIPGRHRINLHAIYAETNGKKVERDRLGPEHFSAWLDWAQKEKLGVDFNPTFFAHPLADSGFTLSHRDPAVRTFWIDHGKACRRIAAWFGRELGTPCVNNVWIPDGYKDLPADRLAPRRRLMEALDILFEEPIDKQLCLDAVEAKLFGIGSESYVVGSHEFYMGYAVLRHKLLCLDAGHFHPTESIADKISSILLYLDEILLHVSRGVRWDSDHIVLLNDDLHAIAQELVRGGFLARVHIGLDFFDASVNRIAAWTLGTRAMIKALLCALLDPVDQLKQLEAEGDLTGRLMLMEESKTMPFGAVWNYYTLQQNVPLERQCLEEIRSYERNVLSQRD